MDSDNNFAYDISLKSQTLLVSARNEDSDQSTSSAFNRDEFGFVLALSEEGKYMAISAYNDQSNQSTITHATSIPDKRINLS